jgi:hypothetical protein
MHRFRDEGNIVYHLRTGGVFPGEQDAHGLPRMYMEYMEGGSLEKKIAQWSQVRIFSIHFLRNVPNVHMPDFLLTDFTTLFFVSLYCDMFSYCRVREIPQDSASS